MNRREQVGSSRDKEVGGHGQHEIFGVGHDGGPYGVGSGRGKAVSLGVVAFLHTMSGRDAEKGLLVRRRAKEVIWTSDL